MAGFRDDFYCRVGRDYHEHMESSFIYGYVRIMSKNYDKRAAQNRWFMEHTAGVRNIFKRAKKQKEAGKEYKIFVCSKCQQMIRVPRGKGKIEIRCPKCGNRFVKKS